MSDKIPQESQNEEVDLGQLFNAIGKLFERLFSFIGKLFKGLFSIIIYALKPLVANFKLVAIIIMVAAVVGYALDKFKEPVYESSMLVKPYFGSKYKLINNVNYFNTLIDAENLQELSTTFEIDTTKAIDLVGFELEIGPETQSDLLFEFDEYLKSIDTTYTKPITYEEFTENRDLLSSSILSIKAKSKSSTIFPNLEKGFIKIFENEYSKKMKEKAEEMWNVEKATYKRQLKRIDSIQNIYLQIRTRESESENGSISVGGLLPLMKEKSETKDFELFQEELKIRNALRSLESKIIEENEYYDIIASFEEVGSEESSFYAKYSLLFPLIVFLIMVVSFLITKIFKFIKDYE